MNKKYIILGFLSATISCSVGATEVKTSRIPTSLENLKTHLDRSVEGKSFLNDYVCAPIDKNQCKWGMTFLAAGALTSYCSDKLSYGLVSTAIGGYLLAPAGIRWWFNNYNKKRLEKINTAITEVIRSTPVLDLNVLTPQILNKIHNDSTIVSCSQYEKPLHTAAAIAGTCTALYAFPSILKHTGKMMIKPFMLAPGAMVAGGNAFIKYMLGNSWGMSSVSAMIFMGACWYKDRQNLSEENKVLLENFTKERESLVAAVRLEQAAKERELVGKIEEEKRARVECEEKLTAQITDLQASEEYALDSLNEANHRVVRFAQRAQDIAHKYASLASDKHEVEQEKVHFMQEAERLYWEYDKVLAEIKALKSTNQFLERNCMLWQERSDDFENKYQALSTLYDHIIKSKQSSLLTIYTNPGLKACTQDAMPAQTFSGIIQRTNLPGRYIPENAPIEDYTSEDDQVNDSQSDVLVASRAAALPANNELALILHPAFNTETKSFVKDIGINPQLQPYLRNGSYVGLGAYLQKKIR